MDLYVATVTGKVFFTNTDGEPRACSASTVNSPGHSMLSTVGHRVHEGGGSWFDINHRTFVAGVHGPAAIPANRYSSASVFVAMQGWIAGR
ncbi:hypothetical protein L6E12_14275 [Actinokineospora sp. PR83]|uniref:hypothetical protein n=1 Tax=Actinokineospora sp. PR83 TaxID=2884908 RepID=UPI001F37E6EB|nr:hypothetical protein [Actinokineospora sp. PR83]MCG8916956.1 hypothetical protein [Actinokineospora sp. PR83]